MAAFNDDVVTLHRDVDTVFDKVRLCREMMHSGIRVARLLFLKKQKKEALLQMQMFLRT